MKVSKRKKNQSISKYFICITTEYDLYLIALLIYVIINLRLIVGNNI